MTYAVELIPGTLDVEWHCVLEDGEGAVARFELSTGRPIRLGRSPR